MKSKTSPTKKITGTTEKTGKTAHVIANAPITLMMILVVVFMSVVLVWSTFTI